MSYASIFVRSASCGYVRTETGRAQIKKEAQPFGWTSVKFSAYSASASPSAGALA